MKTKDLCCSNIFSETAVSSVRMKDERRNCYLFAIYIGKFRLNTVVFSAFEKL